MPQPVHRQSVFVVVPLRLKNPLNNREHWRKVSARGADEKGLTRMMLGRRPVPPLPLTITIVRVGPRKLDSDGLAASAKHVRDAVASWIGVDDGDERLGWVYTQQQSSDHAVHIVVESAAP